MTDYDEHVLDWTYPDRDHVTIECFSPLSADDLDHQAAVFDFSYEGQHFVVVPFTVPGDFSFHVAIFDAEGNKRHERVMSVMAHTMPFVAGEDL